MSIAGGLHCALLEGDRIGCDIVQLFVKSARQWDAAPLSDDGITLFKETLRRTGIQKTMAHASYLINLASANEALYERSIRGLSEEYERCERLGIAYLIVHPGSYTGGSCGEGMRRVTKALNRVLRRFKGCRTVVLLENTAGQGSSLGRTFEELKIMMDGVCNKDRVGLCFDTQHAFAAGYDLGSNEKYRAFWRSIDAMIGIKKIRAFHLNDSKTPLGSRVDRHAHIGRGKIREMMFRLLINDLRFCECPMSLETPKGKDLREDVKALKLLRSWVKIERRRSEPYRP